MMISKKSSAEQNETSETMGVLESANGVENIKSSETDLTIKRKRLVRQEATTHHIDDKDEKMNFRENLCICIASGVWN